MDSVLNIIAEIQRLFTFSIFKVGDTSISLWTLLYIFILFILLNFLSARVRVWIGDWLLAKSKLDLSARRATGTFARYFIMVVGLLIILETAGIDLTSVNVLAGAIGVGIGFGLQNIANNFISGLIILFERPIKIGDRIVVGDIEGDVIDIGGRATTILTNDNIGIIVPNSKLISENVINWSHGSEKVRFRIPVSVAYGSDTRLVESLLLEVASESADVLKDPEPNTRLLQFGDNGLFFELRAWTETLTHRKGFLTSSLNLAIYNKFKEHGIEIPFPQRVVYVKEGLVKSPDSSSA